MSKVPDYTLIESQEDFNLFFQQNQSIEWLAFDTEFIGERRYTPLLCLIQIATPNGYFIIDPIKIEDLNHFLNIIENPDIIKITHAGENDYMLLNNLYGTRPKNIFDTQIAAGFLGDGYPISFQKLLQKEVQIRINKSQMVSDWQARPINARQLKYALNDVLHLYDLWQSMTKKLVVLKRAQWVQEECSKLEDISLYKSNPLKEALKNRIIYQLTPQEKTFLIRLYQWRNKEAKNKNYSKEMVLPSKLITPIVKVMGSGKKTVKSDRRISNKIFVKYWDIFNEMFHRKISDDERTILEALNSPPIPSSEQSMLLDLLNLILKYKCQEAGIAPILLLPRADFNRMKTEKEYFPSILEKGWRKEIIGIDILKWLKTRNKLSFEFEAGRCILTMDGLK